MAIKARQDEDVTHLTPAIFQCFEVIEAVMKVKPFRHVVFQFHFSKDYVSLLRQMQPKKLTSLGQEDFI